MDKGILEFDCHALSHPCQGALDAMRDCLTVRPTSEDRKRQEDAIYALAGACSEDVFSFTCSAAEAIGQVIWSVFSERSRKHGKTQLIASCIEDAPTLQMLKRCEELGCSVKIAPVDARGRVDLDALADLITPRTALISVTSAHGLTGVIQPIEEICALVKEKDILVHADMSYSLGKTAFSFAESAIDYMTFSGEMIHSVKCSGGVFAKQGRPLIPLVLGAPFDFSSFAALSAAARLSVLSLDAMGLETARLRDLFESEILSHVPDAKILFQDVLRLPNTSAILFPRVHTDALVYFLKRKGIYPNQCGSYLQHLHGVLAASGIQTESAISFSLSRMTVQEQVIRAAALIGGTVKSLREISEDLF